MSIIYINNRVEARGVESGEAERVVKAVESVLKTWKNVEQLYIRTKGGEYVGVRKDSAIVLVKCNDVPLGVALLEAEKILLQILNEPKSQHVE